MLFDLLDFWKWRVLRWFWTAQVWSERDFRKWKLFNPPGKKKQNRKGNSEIQKKTDENSTTKWIRTNFHAEKIRVIFFFPKMISLHVQVKKHKSSLKPTFPPKWPDFGTGTEKSPIYQKKKDLWLPARLFFKKHWFARKFMILVNFVFFVNFTKILGYCEINYYLIKIYSLIITEASRIEL